jgi:hypothetical protein
LGCFKLNSGTQISFCEDIWLGNQAFKTQYPDLYSIVRRKHATVAEVLQSTPLNVSFRRALTENKLSQWHDLVGRLLDINLGEESDKFVWQLYKNGSFSVQSMYNHLVNNGVKVT